jgi:single-stranded-DNA-specific exonuclease
MGDESKGSARSYGDFSAADAIRAAYDLIIKGGGHKLAAGVTLPTKNIAAFRERVNEYYRSLKLPAQEPLLLPNADISVDSFANIDEALIEDLSKMEPFGSGNPEPILKVLSVSIAQVKKMGAEQQHIKWTLVDTASKRLDVIAFNADPVWHNHYQIGDRVSVWIQPIKNEWRGVVRVEGRLLNVESV